MNAGSLDLADVVVGLGGARPAGWNHPLAGAEIDSRQCEPNTLFIALRGESVDGHAYVGQAFSRGAIAAIVDHDVDVDAMVLDSTGEDWHLPEKWGLPLVIKTSNSLEALQRLAGWWRLQHDVRVVGITGSLGKTTTKELAASVLGRRYYTLKSEGNYNNEIGLPLTLLHLTSEHECVVLEMGMYDVGEISDLARIARPHVGVVTMIGPIHIERAGSIDRIALAKRELVEALPPAPDGVAILNYDDERVRGMAQATDARVLFYGLSPEADLWADEIEGLGLQGIRFQLHYHPVNVADVVERMPETLHVKIPLLGRHSVQTALRAAAVGLVEGLTWQEIIEGLHTPSSQLRLVAVSGPRGSTVLDDTYNASPASTIAALNLLDELDGRKIAVLGDMLELGNYEDDAHDKVGRRALEVADVIITVGQRARIIGDTAVRWGSPDLQVYKVDSNTEAVELLEQMVCRDDVILVKGSRGMQMEEIVNALGTLERY